MTSIHERIKMIRIDHKLTQQEFADRIGIKRNTVASYEIGRGAPIDAVLELICREFKVNRKWLETGEEPMYIECPERDKLADFFAELLQESIEPGVRFKLISTLSKLGADEWDVLYKIAKSWVEEDGEEPDSAEDEEEGQA